MLVHNLIYGLVLLAGLFTVWCAAKDYDWFMEHRKAAALSRIIGRTGARVFYIIIGLALTLGGIAFFIVQPAAAAAS